jgi:hypothetical protein
MAKYIKQGGTHIQGNSFGGEKSRNASGINGSKT